MMIDRITNRDTDVETVVELAAATLVTTLRVAIRLDTSITVAREIADALDAFDVVSTSPVREFD